MISITPRASFIVADCHQPQFFQLVRKAPNGTTGASKSSEEARPEQVGQTCAGQLLVWRSRGELIQVGAVPARRPWVHASSEIFVYLDCPFRKPRHVSDRSHPRQRVVAEYLARWRD